MPIEQLKEVLDKYDYIDFALLFGSYVDDSAKTLSRVFIAIYTNRTIDLLEQGYLVSMLEDALDKPVDLVLLNDLYKHHAKLAFNIIGKHQVILQRDRKKYIEFKTYTYKYYFDQEPMYRMFDKSLHTRIERGTYGKTQAS